MAHTYDRWYLIGWCQTRQGPRWFRWDRIDTADLTTEPFPDRDLDLCGAPPAGAHPVH